MTALLIPFYRYQPQDGEYYKVYFEWLLKALKIWGDEVDHVYIIDQEWNFTPEDEERLKAVKKNSTILKSTVTGHHWNQFKWAIPQIKEDTILFMDNDVLIWKKGIVKGWFEKAKAADFVGNFDGSGGLNWLVTGKFPVLNGATRMGSYYFILHKEIFDRIPDFDFAPINYSVGTYIKELDYTTVEQDWSDSFGLFTIKLLALNPKIALIDDDRSSISFPDVKTSEPKRLGYYHIRNGNMIVYMLASKISHPEDYARMLKETPFSELTRELGWYTFLTGRTDENLLLDIGIGHYDWDNFMIRFKEYHGL
jgi:hypothetical protein